MTYDRHTGGRIARTILCFKRDLMTLCNCIAVTSDCACSCTALRVVIGVLVVIIVALVVCILWLLKKGE